MKYVVIGAGVAGVTAAKKLKENLPESQIVVLDAEGAGLYSRMRLPEVLAGKLPEAKLILSSGDSLKSLGIEWIPETAASFDPSAKTVALADGSLLSYDVLILAVGASAFQPPVKGAVPGMTFRNMEDLHRILKEAEHAKSAVLIGGGLLGLEAAHALRVRGLSISVVEYMPRLLPRQLNEEESKILRMKFEEMGDRIYTGASVESLEKVPDGWKAHLSSGEVLEGGLVLFSAGIRSNLKLAQDAGAQVDRGIVVGKRLETSLPDVYAVGDCAQLDGTVYGLWMASKDQGNAVAEILSGRMDSYTPSVYVPNLKIPGIQLKEIMGRKA